MHVDSRNTDRIDRPTIAEAFEAFLAEQAQRVGDRTRRKYEEVIHLLGHCLDGYGEQRLSKEERDRFARYYDMEGEDHRRFTEIFGPAHILPSYDDFLGDFIIRKVLAGKALRRAAGTVTKRLAEWLGERGYVSEEDAKTAANRAARAGRELLEAEDLTRLLEEHCGGTLGCSQVEEGYFFFTKVEGADVHVDSLDSGKIRSIRLPEDVARRCRPGWSFSGMIGRRGRNWSLIEVWHVYP